MCDCPDVETSVESNVERLKYKKCRVVRNESAVRRDAVFRSAIVMPKDAEAPRRCSYRVDAIQNDLP
jgi:hypothetical protein